MSASRLLPLALLMIGVAPAHNLHLSHSRLAVEGNLVTLRSRFFIHDLEEALQQAHNLEDFVLRPNDESDALFLSYYSTRLVLTAAGDTLHGQITASGEDGDAWWYELQYSSSGSIGQLTIRNEALFDLFSDQRNIMALVHFPSQHRETLYFVSGSSSYNIDFVQQ